MTENGVLTGRLLTQAEICERLGIKRTKLWTLRTDEASGFPKPARFGHRTLRWREDDIEDFINRQTA